MPEIKATILIVEDDQDLMELNALHLEMAGYQVLRAETAEDALSLMGQEDQTADLILSDIVMPGIGGYEFCEKAKQLHGWNDVPFIFVSSLSTLEERLKGYDVGGDDYIIKPIDPKELIRKIDRVLEVRDQNHNLQEMMDQSQKVAMQAMTYSSDLGQVIEFFKNSVNSTSFKELAELLFDFMRNNGLRASIQFYTPDGQLNFGDQGEISPLEANVIELSRKKSRFFHFGARTTINYQDFSILVKNMPVDDQDKYGIYMDTIGTLCNAIEARTTALLSDDKNRKREELIAAVQGAMDELKITMNGIQRANVDAMDAMISDIDEAMMTLGLSDVQEDNIRQIATNTMVKVEAVFDRVVDIEDKFELVKKQLETVFNN